MQIHLFGAATPTGESFQKQISSILPEVLLCAYSRRDPSLFPADFMHPGAFLPGGDVAGPGLWISFGPIWLLAPFLQELAQAHPDRLQGLRGVIACSSSSAITKRFAINRFDRDLVFRLINAEDRLLETCRDLQLPCRILRPTLIYGRVGPYVDRNLTLLTNLMRRLPLLPLPAQTGLRQPIHATQLAAVVLKLVSEFINNRWDPGHPQIIALGGDIELSYTFMLRALQQSLPHSDPARRCRLLLLPNRFIHAASAVPLILHSPKVFEALLRMSADLSGFTPCHQLLSESPKPFPLPDVL